MNTRLVLVLLVAAVVMPALQTTPICRAEQIVLDTYENGLSDQWVEKSFEGHTRYEVVTEDGYRCVKATSRASASALYYEIKYDLNKYPYISWRWKVAGVLSKGDATKKDGDDYGARVYLVFPSTWFWRTKAVNYLWANRLPKGKAVPNAFTGNVIMIAVESGNERASQWVEETRNVLEDYRRVFKKDPPPVGAVAIMTDTDNTGQEAVAWYGPLRIHDAKEPSFVGGH
jgi:hypothetical protein